MTNVNVSASNEAEKPAVAPMPATAPQQGQSAPKPASDKPNEQQK